MSSRPEYIPPLTKVSTIQLYLNASSATPIVTFLGAIEYVIEYPLYINTGTIGQNGLESALAPSTTYKCYLVPTGNRIVLIATGSGNNPIGYPLSREVGLFITESDSTVGNQVYQNEIEAAEAAILAQATGPIGTSRLVDGAVTNSKLADSSVNGIKIVDYSVNTIDIAPLAVDASKIANQTITATQIANSTITGAQIANNTITSSNIANGSINDAQVGAITGAKIVDGSIGPEKLTSGNGLYYTVAFSNPGTTSTGSVGSYHAVPGLGSISISAPGGYRGVLISLYYKNSLSAFDTAPPFVSGFLGTGPWWLRCRDTVGGDAIYLASANTGEPIFYLPLTFMFPPSSFGSYNFVFEVSSSQGGDSFISVDGYKVVVKLLI